MPHTNTRTRTKTYARVELIELQFRKFCRNYGYTANLIENLGVALRSRWITSLEAVAVDEQDEVWLSHTLLMDWDEHDRLREVEEVAVSDHWEDGAAPTMNDMFAMMHDAIELHGLKMICTVDLNDWLYKDKELLQQVYEALDLDPIPMKGLKWAAESEVWKDTERELAEVAHSLAMVSERAEK